MPEMFQTADNEFGVICDEGSFAGDAVSRFVNLDIFLRNCAIAGALCAAERRGRLMGWRDGYRVRADEERT